jgi:hypothetical protein
MTRRQKGGPRTRPAFALPMKSGGTSPLFPFPKSELEFSHLHPTKRDFIEHAFVPTKISSLGWVMFCLFLGAGEEEQIQFCRTRNSVDWNLGGERKSCILFDLEVFCCL